jgi:hypothetical protein
VAQVGGEQGLAGGHHAGSARQQVSNELGLGRRHTLDRAQQFEVHRPDVHDHAHVGCRDRRQLGDLALPSHGHLQYQRLGAARRLQDRERDADLVVEVLAAGPGSQARPEQRREDVLGRGLARRARDAGDLAAELAPPGAGEPLERLERVGRGNHRGVGAGRIAERALHRREHGLPVVVSDEHAPGPRFEGRGGELGAVGGRTRQPDEQVTRLNHARVDHGAVRARPLGLARQQPASGGRGETLRRQVDHARAPRRARSASRATVTSSNGSLRPFSNSWPCS